MSDDPPLPPDLLARKQLADVARAEAEAHKAALDAETAESAAAQQRISSLVPDLSKVTGNTVDDRSAGGWFASAGGYRALAAAAAVVAEIVAGPDQHLGTCLVTTDSDLLDDDLMFDQVTQGLTQLGEAADAMVPQDVVAPGRAAGPRTEFFLAAAAVAASVLPAAINLFAVKRTVASQSVAGDSATAAAAVASAIMDRVRSRRTHSSTILLGDFRYGPAESYVADLLTWVASLRARLTQRLVDLATQQHDSEERATDTRARLAAAEQELTTAGPTSDQIKNDIAALAAQLAEYTRESADARAEADQVKGLRDAIDGFVTSINTAPTGDRSPVARATIASMMRRRPAVPGVRDEHRAPQINTVLLVRGLGGQANQVTSDRAIGRDRFTTVVDSTIAYALQRSEQVGLELAGVVTRSASVFGELGRTPTIVDLPPS